MVDGKIEKAHCLYPRKSGGQLSGGSSQAINKTIFDNDELDAL